MRDSSPKIQLRHLSASICDGPFGSNLKSSHYTEEGVRVVRLQNIGRGKFHDSDAAFISKEYFQTLDGHDAMPGDLLVAALGDSNHPVGRACTLPSHVPIALVKADCFRVRLLKGRVDSRFLAYWMNSDIGTATFEVSTRGTTRSRINLEVLRSVRVPVPPLASQISRADFLDRKTAAIDALIEKKERLIEVLEQKRTSLIHRAVTKGLDPDVPMKNSGVPWIGEIPEHWEVCRLKRYSPQICVGIVVTPAKYYADHGVPCLRSLNIRPMRIKTDELVFISPESNEQLSKSQIFKGDLVCVRTGQPGTTTVVDDRFNGANCIDLIIIRASPQMSSTFLAYQLNSEVVRGQYELNTTGAIQSHLNVGMARELQIAVPPKQEQARIAEWLRGKLAAQDTMKATLKRTVEKLREYRQSLITAAVTGQLDVTDAQSAID